MDNQIKLLKLIETIELDISSLKFLASGECTPDEAVKKIKDLARKQRRILSKKYHPDIPGGNVEKMKSINEALDEILTMNAIDNTPRYTMTNTTRVRPESFSWGIWY